MNLDTVYNDTQAHLSSRYGVKLMGLGGKTTTDAEYLISIRAENLTRLYLTLEEYRDEHLQLFPSNRDLLTHMIYEKTRQIPDLSQISVTLALMLLGDRLSTISVPDSPSIAQWCSENPERLFPVLYKTQGLPELHWHDLPSDKFHDLSKVESIPPDAQ